LRKKRSLLDRVRDFFWQEIDEDGNPIKYEEQEEYEEDIKIYSNEESSYKYNLNEDDLDKDSLDEGILYEDDLDKDSLDEGVLYEDDLDKDSLDEGILYEDDLDKDSLDEGILYEDELDKDSLDEGVLYEDELDKDSLDEGILYEDDLDKDSLDEGILYEDELDKDSLDEGILYEDDLDKDSLDEGILYGDGLDKDNLNEGSLDEDDLVKDNLYKSSVYKYNNLDINIYEDTTTKKKKFFIAFVLVFTVFVFTFSGYLFLANWLGIAHGSSEIIPTGYEVEDNITKVLIMGIDENPGGGRGRADTVILAIINTANPEIKLLSIPRDTRVVIPRRGNDKINHAYAHGGSALLIETVNDFFDIEVEKYIQLDFNSFREVVDILGGMEFYVERRMFYPAEGIDLRPGLQMLDGDKALQYVRFRGATGDVGRVERQQRFIMEFIEQKLQIRYALRIPELVREINRNVNTNFSIAEMVSIGMAMRALETEKIHMEMLPGVARYIGGVSFWVSDTQDLDEIFPQEEKEYEAYEEYEEPEENPEVTNN